LCFAQAWKIKKAHACKGEALDCFPLGNHGNPKGFALACLCKGQDYHVPTIWVIIVTLWETKTTFLLAGASITIKRFALKFASIYKNVIKKQKD